MAISEIGGLTAAVVGYALDGLSLRQSLIASNIANGAIEGYRPMSVDFESRLAEELAGAQNGAALSKGMLGSGVSYAAPVRADGDNKVSVDHSVLEMNATVLKYQALIEGLNKYMAMTSIAIDGGR